MMNHKKFRTNRVVMERKIRRKLTSKEIVHHVDFDKANNHPANLYLFASESKHQSYHELLKRFVREEIKNGV